MLVKDLCRTGEKSGEVGIEIEVEGNNLPQAPVGWKQVADGSLRGESCEYVLKTPCVRKSVKIYLDRMKKANEESGFEFSYSSRQSIHVHINVQQLNLTQLYNFITLFLIFESELVAWCGEDREHNLFCLQTKDAEGLISVLEQAATPTTYSKLAGDEIRYSALNISSIFKFGSLEFRSMRGTDDYDMIQRWVNILLNIKDVASGYNNPIEIVEDVSLLGVERFCLKVLGEKDIELVRDVESIMQNARRLQTMAYTGDWEGLTNHRSAMNREQGDFDFFIAERVNRPRPSVSLEDSPEFYEHEEYDGEEEEEYEEEDEEEEWSDVMIDSPIPSAYTSSNVGVRARAVELERLITEMADRRLERGIANEQ